MNCVRNSSTNSVQLSCEKAWPDQRHGRSAKTAASRLFNPPSGRISAKGDATSCPESGGSMRIEHLLPRDLIQNRAHRVLVIGAGGTGSAVVMGLPYLDQAMRVWGHRHGLAVALMDADQVSETNCVRQPF